MQAIWLKQRSGGRQQAPGCIARASQPAGQRPRRFRPAYIFSHLMGRRLSVCVLRSQLRIRTTVQSYQGASRINVDPALRSGVTLALYVLGGRLVLIHKASGAALLEHAGTQLAARLPCAKAWRRHGRRDSMWGRRWSTWSSGAQPVCLLVIVLICWKGGALCHRLNCAQHARAVACISAWHGELEMYIMYI